MGLSMLMLMARGSDAYMRLGRLVAGVSGKTLKHRRDTYLQLFMRTLQKRVSRGHHCNVMMHIMGNFKGDLSPDDKLELRQLFDAYKASLVPLSTPIALLSHHLRRHPKEYLTRQHYLTPYPHTLALRAVM